MNKDKKNQIILVGSVVFLIIAVIVAAIVFNAIENSHKTTDKETIARLLETSEIKTAYTNYKNSL